MAAAPDAPPRRGRAFRRFGRAVKTFYWKAYEDNLTGLSGMVAYNLLLSLFPLALLALFIASRVLQSGELETSVFKDLQRLFPSAAENTITTALNNVKASSTGIGVVAIVTSIWFGSSFWGALDTAFCRIYHVECRKWVEQKRFSLVMLFVSLLLVAATVVVPTAQSILVRGAHELPFGLSHLGGVVYVLTLLAGLSVLFGVLCLIYWAVPNRFVPWRAVWPGALFVMTTTGLANWLFPFYLTNVSSVSRFGSTLGFILIALIWFYALSLAILSGAVINSLRFEVYDTGTMPTAEAP